MQGEQFMLNEFCGHPLVRQLPEAMEFISQMRQRLPRRSPGTRGSSMTARTRNGVHIPTEEARKKLWNLHQTLVRLIDQKNDMVLGRTMPASPTAVVIPPEIEPPSH